ncbi:MULTISPECIES: family 43 glycosylhydrolase [Lactobacillus]|uniref:beta-fructofuranosidase n=1 Tax=Lactobacillus xujianguonis TaxID=2495899 RepID=A0A437SW20_9LACO|nr:MULTISPECIES: family 43 glycosylhydrolase [Lactobacillus]RVU71119.1 glycoside hydrolase family 32 protein [Lactobacillus xujianguonis]RVU77467.1 glycoside hydrolase family 32 protein [Lactobacillus xujianguonis]
MQSRKDIYSEVRKSDPLRPTFHYTAPIGWINDPNGLIYYKNYYQLYYQHNPYAPHWDDMHWGHARSKDGLHWEDLPEAMEPEHDYEKSGVFSGSAIEKDGKLYVLYTGHVLDDKRQATETQCVAYSDDGIDFHKYEGNPVMTVVDLPGETDRGNFRDPKVFEHDGKYYCVVAAALNKRGSIVLFESDDLLHWSFKSVLLQNDQLGIMTECPDYFNIDGHDFLAFSVIKGEGQNSVVYLAQGKLDWSKFTFELEDMHRIDEGDDFYASQSFLDEKGDRIVIPWLRSVDHVDYLEKSGHIWNGMMGIPRRETVENGHIKQEPIGTIEPLKVEGKTEISLGSYRLETPIETGQSLVLKGDNGEIRLTHQAENKYQIEIHSPAFIKTISWEIRLDKPIFVIDNSSFEIFAGEKPMSIVTFVAGIHEAILEK